MGYASYVMNRVISAVVVLFAASIVIFSIIRIVPGDPVVVMLGPEGTPELVEFHRRRLGLHLPIWEQYIHWIIRVVTLDLGRTVLGGNQISDLILTRLPRSMWLGLFGLFFTTIIAIPLGIIGGINRNKIPDNLAVFFSQFGISTPGFVLGIALIYLFAHTFDVLPSSSYVSPRNDLVNAVRHVLLPAMTVGVVNAAVLTRFVRSEVLEQMRNDYVRTVKAYGIRRRRIIWKYVMKNAMIPTVTVIGIQIGGLISGLIVIELVFSYPGMGLLLIDSISRRDYPLLQSTLLLISSIFIFVNLVVDLLYGWLDPRIKYD